MQKHLKSRPVVLIAEDDTDQRDCVCEALVDDGFNVETVSDGASALQSLLKGKHDLVIMDIRMPKMDGKTVLHQLRKHEQADAHIPVIMLSAFMDHARAGQLLISGANLAISKPIAINDLLAEVHKLMD